MFTLTKNFTKEELLDPKKLYGQQESWCIPAALYHGVSVDYNSYYVRDSSYCMDSVNFVKYNAFECIEAAAGYIKNCVLRDIVINLYHLCIYQALGTKEKEIVYDNLTACELLEEMFNRNLGNKSELERCLFSIQKINNLLDEIFEVESLAEKDKLLLSAVQAYNFSFNNLNDCHHEIEVLKGIKEFAKHVKKSPKAQNIDPEYIADLIETAEKTKFDDIDRLIVSTFMVDMEENFLTKK